MTKPHNDSDKESGRSTALTTSSSTALSVKNKRGLTSLTKSIVESAIEARTSNQLIDNNWMQKIWDWADKFGLSQIPRQEKELLELETLEINFCRPDALKQLKDKLILVEKDVEKELSGLRRTRILAHPPSYDD